MVPGFAWTPAYTLAPVQPLTGGAALLRHPIAWLLPGRVPRSPHQAPEGATGGDRAVSTPGFARDAPTRAREYQPVVHRLRLSASP
jgi:hypothetical protein